MSARVDIYPLGVQIARGDWANLAPWSKMGLNPALGATEEDIWNVGATYTWPTGTAGLEVLSSSVNDVSTGSGASKVKIWYLNAGGTEFSEEVALNGTNVVPTVGTNIYRVNYFRLSAGNAATGSIMLRNLSDTPIYSQIAAGQTRARQAIYTVPVGKVLYIHDVTLSAVGAAASRTVTFTTRATYDNKAGAATTWFVPYTEISLTDSAFNFHLDIPTRFPALTDIKVSATSLEGATVGNVTLRGFLETL